MRPSKLLRRGARTREREKGDTMEREGRMSERERDRQSREYSFVFSPEVQCTEPAL